MRPRRHEDTKKNTKKDTKKNRFHVIVPMTIALAMSTAIRAQGPAREAEARAPIEAFFKAFNARDNEALKKTLHRRDQIRNLSIVVGRDEERQRMGRAGAIEFCAVRRMR